MDCVKRSAKTSILFFAVMIVSSCSHDTTVCSQPGVQSSLKALIFGKSTTPDAISLVSDLLTVSDISASLTNPNSCSAHFKISNAAETILKNKVPEFERTRLSAAHRFGMSEAEINSGVDEGTVQFEITKNEDENAGLTVTLTNFNVARSKLFSAYLDVLDTANSRSKTASFGPWNLMCPQSGGASEPVSCLLANYKYKAKGGDLEGKIGLSISGDGQQTFLVVLPPEVREEIDIAIGSASEETLREPSCSPLLCQWSSDEAVLPALLKSSSLSVHFTDGSNRKSSLIFPLKGLRDGISRQAQMAHVPDADYSGADDEAPPATEQDGAQEEQAGTAPSISANGASPSNSAADRPEIASECRGRANAAEMLVCSDATLSALDSRMNRLLRRALGTAADPNGLRAMQQDWVALERNRCATKTCLVSAYNSQIAQLQALAGP